MKSPNEKWGCGLLQLYFSEALQMAQSWDVPYEVGEPAVDVGGSGGSGCGGIALRASARVASGEPGN